MVRKLLILFVFLSLFLLGGRINAQNELVHPYITKEAFKLREMSTIGRLSAATTYVGNFEFNSSNNLSFQKLKYQNSNYPIKHVHSYFLQDKNDLPSKTKRPLRISKICKEILVGELFGIGGIFIGPVFISPFVPKDAWSALSYGYISSFIGYSIGNSIGVYIAGNDKYEKGSYLATLGGSIVSGLIGVSTLIILDNKDIGAYLSILGPPMGSIIGFNLSRKPRESVGNAFINYEKGLFQCSLGKVNIYYDYYHKPVLNVNLFQANF